MSDSAEQAAREWLGMNVGGYYVPGHGRESPESESLASLLRSREDAAFKEGAEVAKREIVAVGASYEARDWPEDYEHENGRYSCHCTICGAWFYGHKRRVVCRVCVELARALPIPERKR